ncbi:unnamed protein product, partial [Iphiclides podalirius]
MDPNIYALVLDTLNRATSQNTEVLKPAEKKLQEWETEPGFYSVLLNVLSNHSIDVNVRWLAVMCFKNGVERYWRRNAPNAIAEEEKQKLRQGLLTTPVLSEPVAQIATQQAVLIAKIARFDCPTNWPSLVPELLGALKAPQPLVQHRSLLIFHHVVKALASKRLIGDRRTFLELTSSVYSFILQLWHENTELFLRHIQEGAATELITERLEKALLCLRVLRKLTVFGFKNAHDSQDAVAFLDVVFDRAKTSLECRKLLKGRGIYPLELCEKFIIHLTKVALGVLCFHPFSYVPLIRPSLEFALFYCFTEQGMSLIYERFTIQCLNIVKAILQCVEYKLPKGVDAAKDPLVMQAHQAKASVLERGAVCHMCRHLVTHYFPLSADDLALWDAEPESFATDEAGESWKYSLRVSARRRLLEVALLLASPGSTVLEVQPQGERSSLLARSRTFLGESWKYSLRKSHFSWRVLEVQPQGERSSSLGEYYSLRKSHFSWRVLEVQPQGERSSSLARSRTSLGESWKYSLRVSARRCLLEVALLLASPARSRTVQPQGERSSSLARSRTSLGESWKYSLRKSHFSWRVLEVQPQGERSSSLARSRTSLGESWKYSLRVSARRRLLEVALSLGESWKYSLRKSHFSGESWKYSLRVSARRRLLEVALLLPVLEVQPQGERSSSLARSRTSLGESWKYSLRKSHFSWRVLEVQPQGERSSSLARSRTSLGESWKYSLRVSARRRLLEVALLLASPGSTASG